MAETNIQHKQCSRCGSTHPVTDFYPRKDGKYGVSAVCKYCERAHHLATRTPPPFDAPPDLDGEEWRPVVDYEDLYAVSNFGRVKRTRSYMGLCKAGRILKPSLKKKSGRYNISLCKDGKERTFRVHILVARAFLGPCPEGKEVNHVDGVKTNNRADNLEYLTEAENKRHAKEHGLMASGDRNWMRKHPERIPRGENHWCHTKPELIRKGSQTGRAKLTEEDVRTIRQAVAQGTPQVVFARRFNVGHALISKIVRGVVWKHV